MKLLWKRKSLLIGLSLLTTLILTFHFALFRPAIKRHQHLAEKGQEKERELKGYTVTIGNIPSQEVIPVLTERKEKLAQTYETLKADLECDLLPDETLSQVDKPSLYFKKRLYLIQKELQKEASQAEVTIPASLGFGEEVPSEEEVPLLLTQLKLIERLIRMVIEAGVNHLTSLKLLPVTEINTEEVPKAFFKELPVHLKLRTNTSSLFQFLYKTQNSPLQLIIKNLQIKSDSGDTSEIDIYLTALNFKFKEEKENNEDEVNSLHSQEESGKDKEG